ncbi:MAG TPA: AsmA family protein [Methylocella sp.]|nr:AsmA family protein [Methylocella sp.]
MDGQAPVDPRRSSSARRGLPRIIYVISGVAILAAIVSGLMPWAFSNAALRSEIASEIHRLTGLDIASQGRAVFVVLPEPHISLEKTSFGESGGAIRGEAAYLKGYLRIAALLVGKIEFASITLGKPDVIVNLDKKPVLPRGVVATAANAPPESAEAVLADEAKLAAITLIDGRLEVLSTKLAQPVKLEPLNLTVDWRRLGTSATAVGQAGFSGETAVINAWVANPSRLLRGQQSAISAIIKAPSLSLSLDGELANSSDFAFRGVLHAGSPSARSVAEQIGYQIPLFTPFGTVDLSCDLALSQANAILSNLSLSLDGNTFEGTLAYRNRDSGPLLSGTLATDRLLLQPFFFSFPPAIASDGQWSRDNLTFTNWGTADLDLRISAARMVFSQVEAEEVALSVMRNNGRVELSLAGAKMYGGTAKGRAMFGSGGEGYDIEVAANVSDADFGAASFDAFAWPATSGLLSSSAALKSKGPSMSELMRNLQGTLKIDVSQGQLGGIDLGSALHQINKSPLALTSSLRRGRTPFDKASVTLRSAKGIASIEDGMLRSPFLRLGFDGSINLADRNLDLHARVRPVSGAGERDGEVPYFQFGISGPWDDLMFNPDVGSLIRRSGAAAPLFLHKQETEEPVVSNGGPVTSP